MSFIMSQIQYDMNIYEITRILQTCSFCNHLKVFCNSCDKNANFEKIIHRDVREISFVFVKKKKGKTSAKRKKFYL